MKAAWTVILALGISSVARAEVIQFPDEELAPESVLPVFDQPTSVKNRNVPTAGRFELGAFGGYDLTEPFFNPLTFGGTASYHFTEEHALNVVGNFYLGGASSYSKQLRRLEKSQNPLSDTAKDIMSRSPKTIDVSELAEKAAFVMEQFAIQILFVLNRTSTTPNKPVGILHLQDLMKAKLR